MKDKISIHSGEVMDVLDMKGLHCQDVIDRSEVQISTDISHPI